MSFITSIGAPPPEELTDDNTGDPPHEQREYLRHKRTGERAYLVTRDDKQYARLDRPNQEILRPYHKSDWIPEKEDHPLTPLQLARVAYQADQALLFATGQPRTRDWAMLHEREKLAFKKNGPPPGLRRDLYEAVTGALGHLLE